MKKQFNPKVIAAVLFTGLLFSCKNNISAGVGSDGKSVDSTRTNADTTNNSKNTSNLKKTGK